MLGDKSIGDRLACIALLDADDQTLKIVDSMHVWMAARIDDQRLSGNDIRRTEIGDLFPLRGDRRAGGDAVISARIKTGKDVVEIRALIPDQLPLPAELFRDALHEVDIEPRRAVAGHELERRIR